MNDDLDEANTDYAESDVMLGGANTSNSNGSNDRTNGNSKQNSFIVRYSIRYQAAYM